MIRATRDLNIFIADDHAIVRHGIKTLLGKISGVNIVGEASNGRDAYEQAVKLNPDILVMDISMPELNGLEVTTRISKENQGIKIIILSMYSNEQYVVQAFRAGASGYVLKDSDVSELEMAVDTVSNGGLYITPQLSSYLASYIRDPGQRDEPLERLTSRQREILQLVAEGSTTKEIGAILHLSEKTVETHRANLMKAIGAKDIAAVVRFAIRSGIISPDK